jgi:hypothetical protein
MRETIKTLERFGHKGTVFADVPKKGGPPAGYGAVCICGVQTYREYYAEADTWLLAHLANADEPNTLPTR